MENVVPDRGTERARWASKRQPPCDGGGGQRATVVVVGAATDWTARRFDVLLYKAPDLLRQGASHVRHQRLSGPPGRGQKRLSSLFLFPLALPFPVAVPRCHHQSSSGRAGDGDTHPGSCSTSSFCKVRSSPALSKVGAAASASGRLLINSSLHGHPVQSPTCRLARHPFFSPSLWSPAYKFYQRSTRTTYIYIMLIHCRSKTTVQTHLTSILLLAPSSVVDP